MTLDDKFFKYHEDNPQVFALFIRFAREVKAAGFALREAVSITTGALPSTKGVLD